VVSDAELMQQQFSGQMGMMQANAGPDIGKQNQAERDNLEMVEHTWDLETVEKRLLKKIKN
jgi:hypothetical protein